jgi:sugar/nucleoside kinase (ribokinase family)
MLYSREGLFLLHAYPLDTLTDPTGAGDSFAGGLMGALAASGHTDLPSIREAMLYGSVVASFGVEAFSLDRFETLDRDQVEERVDAFKAMCRV